MILWWCIDDYDEKNLFSMLRENLFKMINLGSKMAYCNKIKNRNCITNLSETSLSDLETIEPVNLEIFMQKSPYSLLFVANLLRNTYKI